MLDTSLSPDVYRNIILCSRCKVPAKTLDSLFGLEIDFSLSRDTMQRAWTLRLTRVYKSLCYSKFLGFMENGFCIVTTVSLSISEPSIKKSSTSDSLIKNVLLEDFGRSFWPSLTMVRGWSRYYVIGMLARKTAVASRPSECILVKSQLSIESSRRISSSS